jgi:hypothetical protein
VGLDHVCAPGASFPSLVAPCERSFGRLSELIALRSRLAKLKKVFETQSPRHTSTDVQVGALPPTSGKAVRAGPNCSTKSNMTAIELRLERPMAGSTCALGKLGKSQTHS